MDDRTLSLEQPVKIGRSVARARAAQSNGIFDCKVLSRNHALIWYNNGKFYLQDTKSSNGTFINNQRLSKSGEESVPREVSSGDIVQFGVDVLENSRKVASVYPRVPGTANRLSKSYKQSIYFCVASSPKNGQQTVKE
ncbi:hypothetical protein J6590_040859 [Homalodisca vitripennis]|nr:hypothetical protein J6590_040859 [Homalodisca vitripennis]